MKDLPAAKIATAFGTIINHISLDRPVFLTLKTRANSIQKFASVKTSIMSSLTRS